MLIKQTKKCEKCGECLGAEIVQFTNVMCNKCEKEKTLCGNCKKEGCECGGVFQDAWERNPGIMH